MNNKNYLLHNYGNKNYLLHNYANKNFGEKNHLLHDDGSEQKTKLVSNNGSRAEQAFKAGSFSLQTAAEILANDQVDIVLLDTIKQQVRLKNGIFPYASSRDRPTQYKEDLYNAILSKLVLFGISGANMLELIHEADPNKINNTLRTEGYSTFHRKTLESIMKCVRDSPSDCNIANAVSPDEDLAGEMTPLSGLLLRCSEYQDRLRPNLWVNKVTTKLESIGISTIVELKEMAESDKLNSAIQQSNGTLLHPTTIRVLIGAPGVKI